MDNKIGAWLSLSLLVMLTLGAVTGIPHLEQPELVDPITFIVLWLIDKR
jgi:hypothetical protein